MGREKVRCERKRGNEREAGRSKRDREGKSLGRQAFAKLMIA